MCTADGAFLLFKLNATKLTELHSELPLIPY